jgi:anti-sigma B factor antagonist
VPVTPGAVPKAATFHELLAGDWLVVRVQGDLDLATNADFVLLVRRRLQEGAKRVCVDVATTAFIDSTGLAALINCKRMASRRGADLVVVAPVGCTVRRAADLVRLPLLVPVLEALPD